MAETKKSPNSFVSIVLITIVIFLAIVGIFFFMDRQEPVVVENNETNETVEQEVELSENLPPEYTDAPSAEFISCLADSGLVVYASKTCPACTAFATQFGGYDAVEELFVICGDEPEKCSENMLDNYVPEIQYNGELYKENRSLTSLAELTGCEL